MEDTQRFSALTEATAPSAAAPLLRASREQFGFIPSPVARAANSPAYLRHLLAGFAAFERSSLSDVEREVVAMTVAFEIGCEYCMAMHSALLSRMPEHTRLLQALRTGDRLQVPQLERLREFVRALIRERGHIPDALLGEMAADGFTPERQLDVLLGVGVYLLSTLGNVMTAAPLDPPFAPFEWARASTSPGARTP